MRYLDWDVLLFPHGSNIPIQEFRTSCYGVDSGIGRTPVLNTFIPSLPDLSLFQVSIHRWRKPKFSSAIALIQEGGHVSEQAVWAIRVIIDGEVVSSVTFANEAPWPQVIGGIHDVRHRLHFPSFHPETLHREFINVSEDSGRVKVFVSEGINVDDGGRTRFCPVSHVVCFTFVHAPQAALERLNIAWPNQQIFGNGNRLQHARFAEQPVSRPSPAIVTTSTYLPASPSHDADYVSISHSMPPPPRPDQALARLSEPPEDYSLSTRSLPVIDCVTGFRYTPSSMPRQWVSPTYQYEDVKICQPSESGYLAADGVMSPPEAEAAKEGVSMAQVTPPNPVEASKLDDNLYNAAGTRSCSQRSYASDVSMHVNCDQFPMCTEDDPSGNGRTIHTPDKTRALVMPSTERVELDDQSHTVQVSNNTARAATPSVPQGAKRGRTMLGDAEQTMIRPRKVSKAEQHEAQAGPASRVASVASGGSIM